MGKTIISVILFVVLALSTISAQTTDNPDRYTSITIGFGISSTSGTFITPDIPDYEWNRYINTPSYHFQYLTPATDWLSVILNANYYQGDTHYFDYETPKSPKSEIKPAYNWSVSLKFYIK